MTQNQLSRYGAIARPIDVPIGAKLFIVSDSDDTTVGPVNLGAEFPVDNDGVVRVYTTIQAASNAATANRGDVIAVLPGYSQNLTAADSWDKAGVTIKGFGQGTSQATIRYTGIAGEVGLSANNIRVTGMRFLAAGDSVVRAIDMDTGFSGQRIDNCIFRSDSNTDNFQTFIRAGARQSVIEDNQLLANDTTGASKGIALVGGDPTNLVIRNNYIYGNFDSAGDTTADSTNWGCIVLDTTNITNTVLTGLIIKDNVLVQLDSNTPQIVNLGSAGVTLRGIATNNQMISHDTAGTDTEVVIWNGLLGVNNFVRTGDSDVRQSIVGFEASRLMLDS